MFLTTALIQVARGIRKIVQRWMYLGGQFTTIGGDAYGRVSCVSADPTENISRAWNPNCGGGDVWTMVLSGSDMYLGGHFSSVSGETRSRAACVDATVTEANPTLRAWNPNCNNSVFTMVLSGNDMYLGGSFTAHNQIMRNRSAVHSITNSIVGVWNPNCNNTVWTMVLNGSDMYIGGEFTTVSGETRNRAACVDATITEANPTLRAWNPNCSSIVCTMILSGSDMYLGGYFTTVRGTSRSGAACVDATVTEANPTLRPWNPNCGGNPAAVLTMVLSGNNMYLGGRFTTVRGTTRNKAACVDATVTEANPTLRPWYPNCNNEVETMVLSGSDMYLGGQFTTVRGTGRNYAACVSADPTASTLRPWNPNCSSVVRAMVLSGSDMYLGGSFWTVRGTSRSGAACVDATVTVANPELRPWNPICAVRNMVLSGSDMYLGGEFTTAGGIARGGAACVDATVTEANPTVRDWNPNCSGGVYSMIIVSI